MKLRHTPQCPTFKRALWILPLAMLVFVAQSSWASEFWEEPCRKDLGRTVYLGVLTYEFYKDLPPIHRAAIFRRIGAVHALCLDRLIAATQRIDWSRRKATEKKVRSELVWVRDLLKGGLKALYGQAKYYRTLDHKVDTYLLYMALRQWAMDNHLPEARFDYMQEQFSKGDSWSGRTNMGMLTDRDYLPAMMEAGRRYLEGDGVNKDRGEAYYWLKRAGFAGGDVSSILETPHERLFLDLRAREWSSLIFIISEDIIRVVRTWMSKFEKG
jgi:hypothetical protein